MRLLVTGGAGFIGSNFVRWLLAGEGKKYGVKRLVVFDSLTYAGNYANVEEFESNDIFRFVKADIRESEALSKVIATEKIDAIANFAAETHVDRSIHDPLAFVRTNIEGTQVLLDCARKHNVERYLQVSTDEVYGSLGPRGYFTERTPLDPSSPYSASKASSDMLVLAAYKTHGYNVCISRCTNNYGPYQFPEKLIPFFIARALADEPLPLYGDGQNVRSWLHVDDHSSALMHILTDGKAGEVYNIGGGPDSELSNIYVTKQILSILGKPETLISFVEDRKGHDRRYAVDTSKIQEQFDWSPKVGFERGLKDTVQWYLDNKAWCDSVMSGEYQAFYERHYASRKLAQA